ncbi:unnamed protein product [Lupinus luteus]|uniref:CASP-like protein n=1 Tax=Lupinus luteus TaxID=3873 RepID=A0AAV1W026_LUPLU
MSSIVVSDSSPHVETPPTASVSAIPNAETQTPATGGTSGGVNGIMWRWKRDDMLKKVSLALRGGAMVFSLISFIAMASNKYGDSKDFDRYNEYRYLVAIGILSTLYTAVQVFRQIRELSTGKLLINPRSGDIIDFFGDQIMAYLLISSSSSAIPLTNSMRIGADNIFTDTSSAAITMSFFAFLCLAVSALISGYKLSVQPYL